MNFKRWIDLVVELANMAAIGAAMLFFTFVLALGAGVNLADSDLMFFGIGNPVGTSTTSTSSTSSTSSSTSSTTTTSEATTTTMPAPGGISSGLVFYFKGESASPATYLYEDDDSTAEYNDGVKTLKNANNLSITVAQSTVANQPIYLENASGSYDGLDFDGVSGANGDFLENADIANFDVDDSFYLGVVMNIDSLPDEKVIISRYNGTTGWLFDMATNGRPNLYTFGSTGGGQISYSVILSTGTLYFVELGYDGSGNSDGTYCYVNGTSYSILGGGGTAITGTMLTAGKFRMGKNDSGYAASYNGKILSSYIYGPAPSAGDRTTIRCALCSEYGLTCSGC